MEVVELANNRDHNLCCGMPSIIRNDFDLTLPAQVAAKKIEQVAQSGASDLYCYCPGCFMQLGGGAKEIGIKTHYSLEEILWALGDEYPVALRDRTKVQSKMFIEKLKSVMAG
jgi:Fe-S oxidoreductase